MVMTLVQLDGLSVETLKKIFGKNLREKMATISLTGSALASELNVSQGVVSRWMNGLSFPDTVTIDLMRRVYGWTTDDLLTERKDEPPRDPAGAIKDIAEALGYERPRLKKKTQ